MIRNNKTVFFFLLTLALAFAACSDKFESPAPEKIYVDSHFKTITGIRDLKDLYYNAYGANTISKSLLITDDIVIKGKVISSDVEGNIYRSIYIQDATGAIELKIGEGQLYNEFPVGRTVYVKAAGLVLGNYRYMLSLGIHSDTTAYANSYINIKSVLNNHILKGAYGKLEAADTLVVSSAADFNDPYDLGRLCRFENAVSRYGTFSGEGYSQNDVFPSYLESKNVDGNNVYQTLTYSSQGLPDTWAYRYDNENFSGSALFVLDNKPFLVRSSGYAKFALKPIPANNAVVDITAILSKYSSNSGGFTKYQLVLNSAQDVVLK